MLLHWTCKRLALSVWSENSAKLVLVIYKKKIDFAAGMSTLLIGTSNFFPRDLKSFLIHVIGGAAKPINANTFISYWISVNGNDYSIYKLKLFNRKSFFHKLQGQDVQYELVCRYWFEKARLRKWSLSCRKTVRPFSFQKFALSFDIQNWIGYCRLRKSTFAFDNI